MRVVYLGNFGVNFSTESHLKYTWERLGHQVAALQEGRATTDQVLEACRGADIFQWSHTHSWNTGGSCSVDEMVNRLKASGVKTMSYHLDFFWGLDQWDKRASRVGKTADWKLDYIFTTDGGHEDFYKERGVNHRWLPPGVVEYGCKLGTPRPELACDVAFVGSQNYHPEYKFRAELVTALQQRYGTRFKLFQGYREDRLNDLYASVKVAVGDHVFAGTPRYWSDRLPETCGRGGFLIYPRTEGLTIPCVTYEPQNLADLFETVDYYLEHSDERESMKKQCFEHVKKYDTYTQRLQTVLEVMGRG